MTNSRKDKILQAALQLFAKQGIEETSTGEISKLAGVATGTLFFHFGSRQGLIDALYVQCKEEVFSGIVDAVKKCSTEKEAILFMAKHLVHYFLSQYNSFLFINSVEASSIVSGEARNQAVKVYMPVRNCITEWTKAGCFYTSDAEFISFMLWGMCKTLVEFCYGNNQKQLFPDQLEVIWNAVKA